MTIYREYQNRVTVQGYEVIESVEVRSLHTLRLESLKLVFQPLHIFSSNYHFGKSVKTSTFCMTSNVSNNCLQTDYFTYNPLYHNSSGSEVYIH